VDAHGMPIRVIVKAGTQADCRYGKALMTGFEAKYVLADKAYDKYLSKSYRVFCAEFSQYRQDLHLHSFVAVVGLQRQPFIFDFPPEYFDRVELSAVGWQKM
jgi:hypothetical protein